MNKDLDRKKVLEWIINNYYFPPTETDLCVKASDLIDAITNGDFDKTEDTEESKYRDMVASKMREKNANHKEESDGRCTFDEAGE